MRERGSRSTVDKKRNETVSSVHRLQFANSYHAKTVAEGRVLKYTRTYEIKELSVPVSQADDLKKFYRIIASDERNNAVLRPVGAKAADSSAAPH